ncbi:MAG: hypothetical protein CL573_03740 [Alphaproteobacteria bacterium]|nr:hypothetical protein [Alphaproteobacteria bacterium]
MFETSKRNQCTIILLMVTAMMLAACGDSTKRALGLQRTAPDEFAVVPRAPLSQPPDFKLRPPRPGAEDLTTVSTREQARQAVFRGDENERTTRGNVGPSTRSAPRARVQQTTTGESAFLARARALDTNPRIRAQIDRETSILKHENQNFIRELLGLKQDAVDNIVDAPEESRRLRENQALGVPPAEGEVPTISRTRKSLLDIF